MITRVFTYLVLAVLYLPLGTARGDETTITITLDAQDLEVRGQLKELKYFQDDNAIRLNDRYLLEDDAPGNGPPEGFDRKELAWYEKLHKGVIIRKDFILDDPRAFSGYLVIDGVEHEYNEHPLHISVNGDHFMRLPTQYACPRAEHYYIINENNYFTDNWFIIEIPVGSLNEGNNEFILWADSEEPSWEVVIAREEEFKRGSTIRTHHPNRSAKSRDGGKSWDFEKLGWKDALDGEYAIRLSLDRYAPEGTYVSPVIDTAAEWERNTIKKLLTVRECRVTWDIDVPEGSDVDISARFGSSPVPTAEYWSGYERVDGLSVRTDNPHGRYLQFMVSMRADNPLVTPSLKGLAIETAVEEIPRNTNVFCRITEFRNGTVIRPSVEFVHEDFAQLKGFRERFELDELVAGASTEFEKQLRLLRFAYEIPIERFDPYNWDFNDVPVLKKDKDGTIVRQKNYTGRRRDLHCLYSNFTLMGACLAMGYPARYVNLQTEGRKHAHEVMEVWSNDFNKWLFLDATRDYYYYDPDTGIPMSLTDANERLAEVVPRTADWYDPIWMQITDFSELYRARIAYREGNNRFSIKDVNHGPHLLLLKGQLHMVIRNDFATRPWLVPWRVSGHWGGNQFYGFYSEKFPRKREYGLNTNRTQDFNFPLNQSELTLSETDQPGVLRVDVDTVTPCFETFLIRFDEGEIQEISASSFEWMLHEGLNRLRVRVRNTAGVPGPESSVTVVMNN